MPTFRVFPAGWGVRLALALMLPPLADIEAQTGTTSAGADTTRVAPGPQYDTGWLHRVFFGSHYRDLWSTPIEAPGARPGHLRRRPQGDAPRRRRADQVAPDRGRRRQGVPVPLDRQGSRGRAPAGPPLDGRRRDRPRPDQRGTPRRRAAGAADPRGRRRAPLGAADLHPPEERSTAGRVRRGVRRHARHDRGASQRRGRRGIRGVIRGRQHRQAAQGGGGQSQRPGGRAGVSHRAAGGHLHRRLGPPRGPVALGPLRGRASRTSGGRSRAIATRPSRATMGCC